MVSNMCVFFFLLKAQQPEIFVDFQYVLWEAQELEMLVASLYILWKAIDH